MKRFIGTKEGQVWIAGHVPELERPPPSMPLAPPPVNPTASLDKEFNVFQPGEQQKKERRAKFLNGDRCYVIVTGAASSLLRRQEPSKAVQRPGHRAVSSQKPGAEHPRSSSPICFWYHRRRPPSALGPSPHSRLCPSKRPSVMADPLPSLSPCCHLPGSTELSGK
ncbi:PREDICTED: protein CROC-4 isoform X4 [Hipposideros armiger]|uniref:Protein CROC-4 isoform X4 n=1 Tax=Hipposideros armiger TaxID=186990 RepID=A0A8B7T204_HIPAR|nr:PREDICTED: protein CROC-4 isoform X4 [Hipposideros armiger]